MGWKSALSRKTDALSKPSKPKASASVSAAPSPPKRPSSPSPPSSPVDKGKEKSKSSSSTAPKKLKSKPPPKDSYTAEIDLPPSDSDEDLDLDKIQKTTRSAVAELDTATLSMKEIKKREMKYRQAAHAVELVRIEALGGDRNAFTGVIGSRTAALDADNEAATTADANVQDIMIENFSVFARGKVLLKNASVKISHGKRYGIVGPNGMGKSTLLKLLAWRKIPIPCNSDVLLVEQELVRNDHTVLEAVVAATEELVNLRKEPATINDIGDDVDAENRDRLAEFYEQLQLMGSDAVEAQTSKILTRLGFMKVMQACVTRSFNSGRRMRISPARALFVQPKLLLLDEQTNHLDLRAVLWLEEYLCRWKKMLVVVSHDRGFLNTVCGDIIHLYDLKLHIYHGNFDDFESGYEQKWKEMNKKFETYDKQIKTSKRTGNKNQIDKAKDRAKFVAKRETTEMLDNVSTASVP